MNFILISAIVVSLILIIRFFILKSKKLIEYLLLSLSIVIFFLSIFFLLRKGSTKEISKDILKYISSKNEEKLDKSCDSLMKKKGVFDQYSDMKKTKPKYESTNLCKTTAMNELGRKI